MPFQAPPKLVYNGGGNYALLEDFVYRGKKQTIVVPKGFETDLASVPRLFWQFIPPFGGYEAAAVLHDYLCVRLATARGLINAAPVNARDTDGMFRRIMREEGVGFVRRWVMWDGVRWGALANPARRAGWWRDAWLVLPLSGIILAAVLAATWLLHTGIDQLFGLLS